MTQQEFMELYADTQKRAFAVYRDLAEQAAVKANEAEGLQKKLESGRYSQSANEELFNRKSAVEHDLRDIPHIAAERVDAIFAEASEAVNAGEVLNPGDVDASVMALLNSGVRMTGADYKPMLARFSDNATMRRVIIDHAEKHGVDLSGSELMPAFLENGESRLRTLKDLRSNIAYTEKWLIEDNAGEMIDTYDTMTRPAAAPQPAAAEEPED